MILNGREASDHLKAKLKNDIQQSASKGRPPGLAVLLVGDNPASHLYVNLKVKACQAVGIHSEKIVLPADATEEQVLKAVEALNQNPKIDGILVQLPIPRQISTRKVLYAISPEKDVDCLTPFNTGKNWLGYGGNLRPCTPSGIMYMLRYFKIPLEGKRVVVIGRSNIVGKPMAELFLEQNSTVTICHSKTPNLKDYTLNADIVVSAVGKPKFLGKEYFHAGSIVIDVGTSQDASGQLSGDIDFASVEPLVKAITPVPKGVGPMTIAMLLQNCFYLYQQRGL